MADENNQQPQNGESKNAPAQAPAEAPQAPAAPATQAPAQSAGGPGQSSGAPAQGGGAPPGHGGHGGRHAGPRPGGFKRGKRNFTRKKKVCRFCVDKIDFIDYKKPEQLQQFVQDRGKILPRRVTGTCAKHQRWLMVAIKRARNIALLPFATEL